ncbi:MAG: hypothetical protein ACPG19_01690 [Saprospiraceae bacterium]
MLDDKLIDEFKEKKSNHGLTKQQGNIMIILLSLILITMIITCFFVFDNRELNWLIWQELRR